jgi:glycosyltransferase involved in cell wall biosynthesis
MAAGAAVVATATDGAREIIEDQKTGLLVPIGAVEQIAESVINLLADPERRRAIATASAQSAATKFSLTRMVDEILKAYRS